MNSLDDLEHYDDVSKREEQALHEDKNAAGTIEGQPLIKADVSVIL